MSRSIVPVSVFCFTEAGRPQEHVRLVTNGVNITQFAFPLAHADAVTLEGATATVMEHHPNETVWVEKLVEP